MTSNAVILSISLDDLVLRDSLENVFITIGAGTDAADCTNVGLC